jgi:hypothetical protein
MPDIEGQAVAGSEDFSKRGRVRPSSPAAKVRLAQALRENLQRRKAQARGQGAAPEAAPETMADAQSPPKKIPPENGADGG